MKPEPILQDRPRLHRLRIILAVCGAFVLVGCSTATRHKWLTMFFDGVPTPGATNEVAIAITDEQFPGPLVIPESGMAEPEIRMFVHTPYLDRQCGECHEGKFSQRMKGPLTQVCFECHDDFLETAKVKHQPAEAGDCTSCHHPHESPNPKLLLFATQQAMCFECHDDFLETAKVKHQPVEAGDCAACHNPHASPFKGLLTQSPKDTCLECHDTGLSAAKIKHAPVENGECMSCHNPHVSEIKGLLLTSGAGLCFECHDDFLEEAKFKHSPAESGDCSSCHSPHESDHKGLLLMADPQVCFECHDEPDMARVKAHKPADLAGCVKCHDPHAGEDKYFLKPGATQSASKEAPLLWPLVKR